MSIVSFSLETTASPSGIRLRYVSRIDGGLDVLDLSSVTMALRVSFEFQLENALLLPRVLNDLNH